MRIKTLTRILSLVTKGAIPSIALILRMTDQDFGREQHSSTPSTSPSKSKPDDSTGTTPTSTGSSEPILPSTASDAKEAKAKALFIYYLSYYGTPLPQIIFDLEMFGYQCEMGRIPVVQRHEITLAEASLGIDKLVKLYPCVRHTDVDHSQLQGDT